jgi:hypothetical protein
MKSHTLDLRQKKSQALEYIGAILVLAGWGLFFAVALPLLLQPTNCIATHAQTVVCQ